MTIFGTYKDSFDRATKTANKLISLDHNAMNLVYTSDWFWHLWAPYGRQPLMEENIHIEEE